VLSLRTAGAGGFGDPATRDPAAVLRDVRQGLVSVETARGVYRVALAGNDDAIDVAETNALRLQNEFVASAHKTWIRPPTIV
jgi:N-methylhydantoinase B